MIKKYLEQFGNVHDSYGSPGGPGGPEGPLFEGPDGPGRPGGPTLPGGVVGVGGSSLYFKNKLAKNLTIRFLLYLAYLLAVAKTDTQESNHA